MNLGWKHLAGQLLNGADLSRASLEEIDILLEEYPYFAGLHFLKAAKVKALQKDELSGTVSKAALYFPNPHWFSLMLEQSADPVGEMENIKPVDKQAEIIDINIEETEEEPVLDIQESEPPLQPDWEQNLAENPVFQQHQVSDEEHFEQEIWHQQASSPDNEPIIEEPVSPQPEPEVEFFHTEPAADPEPVIDEVFSETTEVQEQEQEQQPEPEQIPEEMVQPQPDPEPTKTAETVPDELEIPFEPLYTIDYFASQGIKIAAETSPKDQLSLKLRSFTEWLRAMKKLHPEKIDKNFNQEQEEQVRVIAESSNAPQVVYTEAMAEVFIKQGKKDKAKEVFEKLSLLDPGKSAYFAVRIKELKEN